MARLAMVGRMSPEMPGALYSVDPVATVSTIASSFFWLLHHDEGIGGPPLSLLSS